MTPKPSMAAKIPVQAPHPILTAYASLPPARHALRGRARGVATASVTSRNACAVRLRDRATWWTIWNRRSASVTKTARPAFDTSTGIRFHPLESLFSTALKIALVVMLGASACAVVAFEILLNVSSMFNHANLRLPVRVDRVLRWVLVTPDMHRVHHSVVPAELSRNFGFALPWWGWLCGTYQDQPAAGLETMAIGLSSIAPARAQRLVAMLVEPFRPAAADSGGAPP